MSHVSHEGYRLSLALVFSFFSSKSSIDVLHFLLAGGKPATARTVAMKMQYGTHAARESATKKSAAALSMLIESRHVEGGTTRSGGCCCSEGHQTGENRNLL